MCEMRVLAAIISNEWASWALEAPVWILVIYVCVRTCVRVCERERDGEAREERASAHFMDFLLSFQGGSLSPSQLLTVAGLTRR